jgi:cardiolipin synthase A/B
VFRAVACTLMALTAGCRTPLPASAQRTRELRTVEESRVIAFHGDGRLALRFRLKGRDAYAVAALPDKTVDARSAMEFDRNAKARFAAMKDSGQPVPVLGRATWRAISMSVAGELAPASAKQCALVTTGGQELLVNRDVAGVASFRPMTERPAGMKIVRRVTGPELVQRLTRALNGVRQADGPVIILTGQYPALLLFEPRVPRVTFISAPADESLKLPLLGDSPDVTVRGLLSLGVRSGVLTTLKNPVTTLLRGGANVISMADSAVHGLLTRLPAGPVPPLGHRPPMNAEAWEQYLDGITKERRVPATVRLRIGGEQFFPDFIQAIQDARESIDIQLYIFDTDDYAIQIADLLKQRSREVRVRVMIDEVASLQSSLKHPKSPQPPGHRAPSSIIQYLRRDSNIRVRPMTMPALSANHTKMIIIDGRRAWLGGMNIGREYRSDWHDMMIEVTGPIIGWMQRSFVRTWVHNSWTGDLGEMVTRFRSSREAAARIPIPAGAIPVRPLRGSALHFDLKDAQFAAVRNAQQSIWIENGYMSYSRFIRELVEARRRGVDVRVIMPAETDSKIMEGNNRALIPQLLRNGIRVWLLPEISHVKAAIYDGWACIGSANFDRLSFRVNHEFNIGYSDPAAVDTLRRDLFLEDMARGTEIKAPLPGSMAPQFTDTLLQVLAGQF